MTAADSEPNVCGSSVPIPYIGFASLRFVTKGFSETTRRDLSQSTERLPFEKSRDSKHILNSAFACRSVLFGPWGFCPCVTLPTCNRRAPRTSDLRPPPDPVYRISFLPHFTVFRFNGSEPYMLPEYFPFGSFICGDPKALPRLEPFWGLLWFLPLFIFIIAPNSEKSIVFFKFFIFFYIDCPSCRKSVFFPVYRSAKRAKCRVGNFYR